jgi:hypothetical protein
VQPRPVHVEGPDDPLRLRIVADAAAGGVERAAVRREAEAIRLEGCVGDLRHLTVLRVDPADRLRDEAARFQRDEVRIGVAPRQRIRPPTALRGRAGEG